MRKEMERQERERRKEEERLLREKQREEERYLKEQRKEIERRERLMQKEYIKVSFGTYHTHICKHLHIGTWRN